MSKKITYQVGLGLLSLVMVGAAAQAETASEDSGINFRVKAGAVSGSYENAFSAGREDTADFTGLELSAALLFSSGMFVEVKSSTLEADSADVESNNIYFNETDWSRDELSVALGVSAGTGAVVIGYQDNETTNETAAPPTAFGDVNLASSGFTMAYGLAGLFGESKFGYNATVGLGLMTGEITADNGASEESDSTLGYSLAAGLSYAVLEGLAVGIDYKWQAYEYEFTGMSSPGLTGDLTIEETISRLVLSASYTF